MGLDRWNQEREDAPAEFKKVAGAKDDAPEKEVKAPKKATAKKETEAPSEDKVEKPEKAPKKKATKKDAEEAEEIKEAEDVKEPKATKEAKATKAKKEPKEPKTPKEPKAKAEKHGLLVDVSGDIKSFNSSEFPIPISMVFSILKLPNDLSLSKFSAICSCIWLVMNVKVNYIYVITKR